MLKIENTDVYGWEAAIRGMRNPLNSWNKSDSCFKCNDMECENCFNYKNRVLTDEGWKCDKLAYSIGENDLKLMKTLSKAGNDHGKFLRMINVTVDLTAPLYWWKEFDTYKVGTVANSCSTMHKIHAKEFTLEDFSCEHLNRRTIDVLEDTIYELNRYRILYLNGGSDFISDSDDKDYEPKDKDIWWQMIQLLPSSYNQKRTAQLNYQVLKAMYHARCNHKLDEWHVLCDWMVTLPYFKELCLGDINE